MISIPAHPLLVALAHLLALLVRREKRKIHALCLHPLCEDNLCFCHRENRSRCLYCSHVVCCHDSRPLYRASRPLYHDNRPLCHGLCHDIPLLCRDICHDIPLPYLWNLLLLYHVIRLLYRDSCPCVYFLYREGHREEHRDLGNLSLHGSLQGKYQE